MSLVITSGDILTQIENFFNQIWPILFVGLGYLAAPFLIRISRNIFVNVEDKFNVWNWRRKGWMEKNSYKFTDKMFQEYKPRRRRRY